MRTLQAEWQTNAIHQANLPERVVDWPTATRLLIENNAKLKGSRTDLTNAQEGVRQVFRDLTPTLNLRSGVSRSLKSLGSTGVDDVTFSADSFFSVPGMVSFGARLYAAKLFELRARTANELAEREQVIALYRTFLAAHEVTIETERLSQKRRAAETLAQVDPVTSQIMLAEVEVQELTRRRDIQSVQDQVAELLGDRSVRWALTTNGLPELRYDLNPLPVADTNRVAQLQMKLVAIELEAAKAQLLGIRLRYWPELNIYVTGPPIYQRYGNEGRWWDADQVRASADLFWNIDTRGYISRQMRQTKRSQALQRERMRMDALALIDRLIFTQGILEETNLKARLLNSRLQLLLAAPPGQDYTALQRFSADYRLLEDEQRNLRRQLAELNTLFWFVDEQGWGSANGLPGGVGVTDVAADREATVARF
ncbi:MAG TPA: hypothetical protein VEH27_17180 [Methylomirabilota bacterium]|nr:hypothetical protein [Methylomirabilota bacterium]